MSGEHSRAVTSASSAPGSARAWVACVSCDLLVCVPELREHERADCPRCGQLLERSRPDSIRRTLALAVGALLLYVVAQSATFMSFELDGRVQDARILTGILALFADGKAPLASLILLTAVVAPLCWILSLLYVSIPLSLRRRPPGIVLALRFCRSAQDWSMLEVFLLAVIVTYVKMASLAHIGFGPGSWALIPLILVMTAAASSYDARVFWQRFEALR
jgi:paraquat-inducible protein A